jgi:hypothetical protein
MRGNTDAKGISNRLKDKGEKGTKGYNRAVSEIVRSSGLGDRDNCGGSLVQPLSGLRSFSHGSSGQALRPAAPWRSNLGLDYKIPSGFAVSLKFEL